MFYKLNLLLGAKKLVSKVLNATTLEFELLERVNNFLKDNRDTEGIEALNNFKFVAKFLIEYTATLSDKDRLIYDILTCLERVHEVNLSPMFPLVWGEKSKEHYENLENLGSTLHKIATSEILDYIDPSLMWRTVRFCSLPERKDIYDVRFILQLMANIEHVGTDIDCRKFIESNCLSVMFAATSHLDSDVRKLAYYSLQKFLNILLQVQESEVEKNFPERPIFVYILRQFKQSFDDIGVRTVHIISHFLAKVCKLVLYPDNDVYTSVLSFLCLKPKIDLDTVPEFYKLLLSTSPEKYKVEREWVLGYLNEAILDSADYNTLQNRSGIKLLQGLFSSCICDQTARKYILQIFKACANIPSSAQDLFIRQNLHSWIVTAINLPHLTRWERVFLAEIYIIVVTAIKDNLSNQTNAITFKIQADLTGTIICEVLKPLVEMEARAQERIHAIENLLNAEWVVNQPASV
ncbi:unnamed protein product [Auanema sp. JU1783]|nr:unnamed protein product [Auanema sp. JU1783]